MVMVVVKEWGVWGVGGVCVGGGAECASTVVCAVAGCLTEYGYYAMNTYKA